LAQKTPIALDRFLICPFFVVKLVHPLLLELHEPDVHARRKRFLLDRSRLLTFNLIAEERVYVGRQIKRMGIPYPTLFILNLALFPMELGVAFV
jgi:hypothetical protein